MNPFGSALQRPATHDCERSLLEKNMKHEVFSNHDAHDLIRGIVEKSSGRSPHLLGDLVAKVAEELGDELGEIMDQIGRLKEVRAGWHPGQSAEDARRRLHNPKLNTPYPSDRAGALLLKRIKLSEEVTALVAALAVPLAKLEMVDAELAAVRHALEELERTRAAHKESGLYAGSADFLSRLHTRFEIGWADLCCLTADEEQAIANIVLCRAQARPKALGED
ncbi:hypothetical protein V6R86_01645 [Sphingomonas kaistensis]|uniref:DUF3102 domain-containing protein n=1 Tax=Sphingomonas kaistensis TaxID=298708 RepID=A0ABZ2FX60_9SPHN